MRATSPRGVTTSALPSARRARYLISRSSSRMVKGLPARFGLPSTSAQRRSPTRPVPATSHERKALAGHRFDGIAPDLRDGCHRSRSLRHVGFRALTMAPWPPWQASRPITSRFRRVTRGSSTPSARRRHSTSARFTCSKAVRVFRAAAAPSGSRRRSGSGSTWSRATASGSTACRGTSMHPVWVDDPALRPRRAHPPRGAPTARRRRLPEAPGDADPRSAARHAPAALGDDDRERPARRPRGAGEPRPSRDGRRRVVSRHPVAAARPESRGLHTRPAGGRMAAAS